MLTYSETILFPVGIYLFEVRYKNTRNWCEICPASRKKDTKTMPIDTSMQLVDIAVVSFFLTLNIFCFLVYCFLC